ncbi:phospho-N-acetylmuramoyl-pentapeptide-transferase [Halobacteroides halobius DSM 5150]|uniref:Phospho-N-acetylmuramoyl-pentapeptide-transferase n=1 Tax=Halobacteroides halobius (strain ATCC 35273 / DSM 5150 / MD-1) TaxID=748449 RepID=L0K8U4_HALHC|nr:phospho-N-acetylmuramoyl-pentapeptide-transferase [Halobacteroides halobius]AGB41707.1 phospho-N-acetylmuramoyl-pentapeptide-transferase [Halobacteroides halobius DSM 5150]
MIDLIYAAGLSFIISIIIGPFIIKWFTKLEFGQNIREVGPESHLKKSGIPTMGGVIIILAILISTLFFARPSLEIVLSLFVMVGYGILGLLDDSIKIIANRSLGLRAWQKIVGQVLIALVIGVVAITKLQLGTEIIIPYILETIDLGYLFIPFVILVVIGTSNAVNLTDGLDGLAAGVTIIVAITYAYMIFKFGDHNLAIFATSIAGACLGFSWFNSHPAQVFMGDTGSLALGGAIAALSILTRTELFLFIIGGVYVIEALSVMIQVGYYRLTNGKRIFKMSPVHHHFELDGWEESKVVVRFWILAIILSLVGLLGLYNLG